MKKVIIVLVVVILAGAGAFFYTLSSKQSRINNYLDTLPTIQEIQTFFETGELMEEDDEYKRYGFVDSVWKIYSSSEVGLMNETLHLSSISMEVQESGYSINNEILNNYDATSDEADLSVSIGIDYGYIFNDESTGYSTLYTTHYFDDYVLYVSYGLDILSDDMTDEYIATLVEKIEAFYALFES